MAIRREHRGVYHAVLDIREKLLHLGVQACRDPVGPAVITGQSNRAVGDIAYDPACTPRTGRVIGNGSRHLDFDALEDRHEPQILVHLGHSVERVRVDTDHCCVEIAILDGRAARVVDRTADRKNDVRSLVENALTRRPYRRVARIERSGECTVLCSDIPADDLDAGALYIVVVGNARAKPSMKMETVGILMPP